MSCGQQLPDDAAFCWKCGSATILGTKNGKTGPAGEHSSIEGKEHTPTQPPKTRPEVLLEEYPEILRPKQVAEILRVSQGIVYQYLDAGAIRHFRLTRADGSPMRRVFIPKRAILDYLEGVSREDSSS